MEDTAKGGHGGALVSTNIFVNDFPGLKEADGYFITPGSSLVPDNGGRVFGTRSLIFCVLDPFPLTSICGASEHLRTASKQLRFSSVKYSPKEQKVGQDVSPFSSTQRTNPDLRHRFNIHQSHVSRDRCQIPLWSSKPRRLSNHRASMSTIPLMRCAL